MGKRLDIMICNAGVADATQCFRDGPWPHIGLKFNASESNENQTGGTWDVVGKHRI